MASEQYIIIPGTNKKVYEGSVVMLHRLPNLKWILHKGYYEYNGRNQKGWYFSSIPSDTTMPVFNEDLVAMTVLDGGQPGPPFPPPMPPGPFPPTPPAPVPVPFTPKDKKQLSEAMLTVETLSERDKLSWGGLQDGKIVRVNDIDGHGKVEYYEWNSATSSWREATLGYRYMTREEIVELTSPDIVNIIWSDEDGALVLVNAGGEESTVPMEGLAHDPSYNKDTLTLTFPIFGRDDLVITLPGDMYIRSIRFEKEWQFPDGVKPAIVVVVSDGTTEQEIAGDATGMVNIYTGGDTESTTVTVSDQKGQITADVKISTLVNNRIKVDAEGLYVDVSDLEEKIDDLESRTNIGEGEDGTVVVTDDNGLARSGVKIGGETLSDSDDDLLATEEAVKKALTWQVI